MATFFSAPANQRDIAGGGGGGSDMPFHHYPASNPYQESSTAGLAPLPATAVASGGDGRNELAIAGATEESHRQRQQLMTTMQSGQAMQRHGLLSLSLGAQVPAAASLYQYGPAASAEASPFGACQPHAAAAASGGAQAGVAVRISRYLKAARELLDELVNVQDAVVKGTAEKNRSRGAGECKDADQSDDKVSNRQGPAAAAAVDSSSAELSHLEKQDLQNKVTALQALLDQVDERYRNYRQQMQAVAGSLDAAAERGTARPYTALALQTISRHFRSLRDAIGAQVRSARRSLGEPDAPHAHGGGIHRLRYIDQHLWQQCAAAQQLGMLPQSHHHHQLHEQHAAAWRPQRGLPESAVSVLRAWLFEHFLHPYPKESDKMMLARQAGLTRGQVSNWFINARVRLWKPMIEEMYREEFGAEMESNSSSENGARKGKDEPSRSPEDQQSPSIAAAMHGGGQLSPFKSEAMAGADNGAVSDLVDGAVNNAYTYSTAGLSLHQHRHHHHEQSAGDGVGSSRLLQEALAHHGVGGGARFLDFGSGGGGVGGYDGGSVSLTLGLHRHAGAGGVTVVTAEQPGLAPAVVRGDGVYAGAFDYMDGPDDRQLRASSSQLLHDFVT